MVKVVPVTLITLPGTFLTDNACVLNTTHLVALALSWTMDWITPGNTRAYEHSTRSKQAGKEKIGKADMDGDGGEVETMGHRDGRRGGRNGGEVVQGKWNGR